MSSTQHSVGDVVRGKVASFDFLGVVTQVADGQVTCRCIKHEFKMHEDRTTDSLTVGTEHKFLMSELTAVDLKRCVDEAVSASAGQGSALGFNEKSALDWIANCPAPLLLPYVHSFASAAGTSGGMSSLSLDDILQKILEFVTSDPGLQAQLRNRHVVASLAEAVTVCSVLSRPLDSNLGKLHEWLSTTVDQDKFLSSLASSSGGSGDGTSAADPATSGCGGGGGGGGGSTSADSVVGEFSNTVRDLNLSTAFMDGITAPLRPVPVESQDRALRDSAFKKLAKFWPTFEAQVRHLCNKLVRLTTDNAASVVPFLKEQSASRGSSNKYHTQRTRLMEDLNRERYQALVSTLRGLMPKGVCNKQKDKTVIGLLRSAVQNAARFQTLLDTIREKSGTTSRVAPLKGVGRALEKLALGNHDTAESLKDVLRGSIIATTLLALMHVLDVLNELTTEKKIVLVQVDDRFSSPAPGGWSDVLIYFTFPDSPLVMELQIQHSRLFTIRNSDGGHGEYESSRVAQQLLRHPNVRKLAAGTKKAKSRMEKLQIQQHVENEVVARMGRLKKESKKLARQQKGLVQLKQSVANLQTSEETSNCRMRQLQTDIDALKLAVDALRTSDQASTERVQKLQKQMRALVGVACAAAVVGVAWALRQ